MEARYGHDFSGVRVHRGPDAAASATAIGALAYTVSEEIYFGPGAYSPNTPQGVHLIAHELAHVVQQSRTPLSSDQRHQVEPARSLPEREADRAATSVLIPGSPRLPMSERPTGVGRSTRWAVIGGIAGAVVGGLLGALAGPAGIAIGAIAGAAFGAWVAGSATNTKTDDHEGTARQRIHRLLTRSATDWVVTDEEALQALGILQEVEKKDPQELLDIVRMMKFGDEWERLREELPATMRPSLRYFEMVACNPDRGYVMPGDRLQLTYYFPGRPRIEPATGEAAASHAAGPSGDYDVGSDGITLPGLDPVPVVGMSLQQAADKLAEAYTDPLWTYEMGVELKPVRRGIKYAGFGEVSPDADKVDGLAVSRDKKALAHRDKRNRFNDHVPWALTSGGGALELAVVIYHEQVDKFLDQHEDPETLWVWAKSEAQKRLDKIHEKTPAQVFLEFGRTMMSRVSTMPPPERARVEQTYSRYMTWLDRHENDPKLSAHQPMDIWVQAYLNVVTEEVGTSTRKAMEELKEKRRDEAWTQSEVKFGQVMDFAMANIWRTREPSTASTGEQISPTTGEAVTVTYLIQPSTAEKIIRDKIANDFLHSVLDRMQRDPEAFNKTTVRSDFSDYLKANPEQADALFLTSAHPDVERFEDAIDIPGWQIATEIVVGLIPFVGTAVALYEAGSGEDLFGHPLSTTERTIVGVGALLPGIFKTLKLGKEAFVASKVVREYGLSGAEASRVYRLYTGLGPGTAGAKLFGWGLGEIKAGRAIDDPKVLKEMEGVLKELGMTERETARAVMPAVERQAEAVAREEVQSLKVLTGPMSDDTEKLLLAKPALREALTENRLAAIVLKKCASPCFPEQATAAQIDRLERLLERVAKSGKYDEEAVRTFLYKRREALDAAISDLERIATPGRVKDGTAATELNTWLKNTKALDTRLASAEQELAEARHKTIDYQQTRRAAGESLKGGAIKDVWNAKEKIWIIQRQKAYPGRQILEQAQILGVRQADGTIRATSDIAGTGRTLDFVEARGTQIVGGDLKSPNELVKSVAGGVKNPKAIEGEFRVTSKVGGQHAVEEKVLTEARKGSGKLVIRGKNVLTGKVETLEVDVGSYSSEVLTYADVHPN